MDSSSILALQAHNRFPWRDRYLRNLVPFVLRLTAVLIDRSVITRRSAKLHNELDFFGRFCAMPIVQ
jgi:hypothetical protein